MKKTIEIKKKLEFSSMIGEVSAISLENHLEFVDSETIKGYLTVLGRYKSTVASRLEEDFNQDIPVEITLTVPVDPATGNIEVGNFYYDVVDGESILCNIEMNIRGEDIIEERECDGDSPKEKEIEIPHIEESVPVREEVEEEKIVEEEEGIFTEAMEESLPENEYLFNIDTSQESYGTFVVYIVRQNETINSIIEKYHTSVEEIEKYNDIKDLSIGSKIIIPISNEQDS